VIFSTDVACKKYITWKKYLLCVGASGIKINRKTASKDSSTLSNSRIGFKGPTLLRPGTWTTDGNADSVGHH